MPRLTKRIIDSLKPRDREYVVWDRQVTGFGARVRPSGKITYILKYRVGGGRSGTIRKPTIGMHGSITADQARRIARQWLAEVARGGDPSAERAATRNAPTMAELADRYMAEYASTRKKPRSAINDEILWRLHILPALGRKRVNAVTYADALRLHGAMHEHRANANRALALLSRAFNLAEAWGSRPEGTNPCRRVKRFPETKRERFLSAVELGRLGAVLSEAEQNQTERPPSIAAIRLLLFTGCRMSEILTLEWKWIDFERRCLRLPDSKTGAKVVLLTAPALEVLAGIERVDGQPRVIVSSRSGVTLNLHAVWWRVRRRAELGDIRLHDLRHSFASFAAASGFSLPMIGRMLGHAEARTTERYAHLAFDSVQLAMDAVAGNIAAAMKGGSAAVVEMTKARR